MIAAKFPTTTTQVTRWITKRNATVDPVDVVELDRAGIRKLTAAAVEIAETYPVELEDARYAALEMTYRLLTSDPEAVVSEYGAQLEQARDAERLCMVALHQAVVMLVSVGPVGKRPVGIESQSLFSGLSRVNRATVNKWVRRLGRGQ